MAWAANPNRKVAGAFSLAIVQMGARLYLPTAGRFLQTDPIEGGTPNNYVYPPDPVNMHDLSGECVGQFIRFLPLCQRIGNALVAAFGGSGGRMPYSKGGSAPALQKVDLSKLGKIALVPQPAYRTLNLIDKNRGMKLPGYAKSNAPYNNRSFPKLPDGGSYKEYDLYPKSSGGRGMQRIVIDDASGSAWYTPDHYQSWVHIR